VEKKKENHFFFSIRVAFLALLIYLIEEKFFLRQKTANRINININTGKKL